MQVTRCSLTNLNTRNRTSFQSAIAPEPGESLMASKITKHLLNIEALRKRRLKLSKPVKVAVAAVTTIASATGLTWLLADIWSL